MGNVDQSVKYLETAIDSSLDPRLKNKDELPLAETFLNIANAYSFLGNHEQSITFADKAQVYASQQVVRLEK